MKRERGALKTGCLIKSGIAVGSLFVCVIGLEIAARCLIPTAVPKNVVNHPILNHVWRPGLSYEHSEYESVGVPPYTHHYNNQGFIGTNDLALEKPMREYRIFVVGDSFVEGTVPMEQSMPSVLRKTLQPILHNREMSLNVVNAGISSYSPVLHYLLVTKFLLRYKPDLIIVAIDMTDVFDDYIYNSVALRGPDGEIVAVPPGTEFSRRYERTADGLRERLWFERLFLPAFKYSRLVQFVSIALSLRSESAADMPGLFDWCTDEKNYGKLRPATIKNINFSMSMLRKLSVALKSEGIKLLVTAVPHVEQFQSKWSASPLETVAQTCAAMDEPYFDSYAEFKSATTGDNPIESFYTVGDMHFNANGYEVWGKGLARVVEGML